MSKSLTEIKNEADIVEVIGRYVHLKKEGPHFKGQCCFHEGDNSASLVVTPSKKIFKCFGCGTGGDVIDFLVKYGRSMKDALKELQDPYNTEGKSLTPEMKESFKPTPRPEWKQINPPVNFSPPDIQHYTYGAPNRIWEYKSADGWPMGYVCRFDLKDGKQVLPYCYCTDGTFFDWRWKGFEKPRPLYNLDKITADGKPTIIIGEGEKTADAIAELIQTATATTWIGGSNNVGNTDWSPVFGKKIILWPDNDYAKKYGKGHEREGQIKDFHEQPGNHAMYEIYLILRDHCPTIKWVQNPPGKPCGWDAADADWGKEEGYAYVKSHLIDVPHPKQAPLVSVKNDVPIETEPAKQLSSNTPEPPSPPDDEDEGEPEIKNVEYFRFLGYQKENGSNTFHFYSFNSKSVISLSPSAMRLSNLLQLAPLQWWNKWFPSKKSGFSIEMAQNWIIQRSADARIFNEKWIRGRGAWIDNKQVVIHAGDHLIVDGVQTSLSNFRSKYIYEIGEELGFKLNKPLNNTEARKLLEITSLLNWEREVNAYLLAGWCVIAPVCGALDWRPHIWLTGSAGTGKSWTFLKIIRLMLGETAIAVQGGATEAGIRQTLMSDALPIVYDEAEGENRRSQERMEGVLSLMRTASATDGGIMPKGTAGGAAKNYRVRSCFAFASIGIQVTHQSDRTRVTILSMKKIKQEIAEPRWKQLQTMYDEFITEDFSERLRSRTVTLLPVILKNAKTFANAAAAELGEQRAGDQVGALLAGAYSLTTSEEITFNDAVEWIKKRDWSEERGQEFTRDEASLLNHILGLLVTVETHSGRYERTIGEMVQFVAQLGYDSVLTTEVCQERLLRIGVKMEANYFIISNDSDFITKALSGTAWHKNHNKILSRIEGAISSENRFASGLKSRSMKLPLTLLVAKD